MFHVEQSPIGRKENVIEFLKRYRGETGLPDSTVIQYEGAVPGLSVPFIAKDGRLEFKEWTETTAMTVRGGDSVAVRLEIGHG